MTHSPHTDPAVKEVKLPAPKPPAPQAPKPKKATAPLRIVSDRGKAEPFPIEALPHTMRMAVEVIAERAKAPVGMVAFSAIGALSLAGQAVANVINPASGFSIPTSLFLAVVASSGDRKSTVDSFTHAAIAAQEKDDQAAYNTELAHFKLRHAAWSERRDKAVKSGDIDDLENEPDKPLSPKMRLSSGTIEGVLRELETRHSLAISTAEGGLFIAGHGMTKDTKMRTITTLTKLWDEGAAERIVRAESKFLQDRRCSVNLAFQEVFVDAFINDNSAGGQGFLPRFLMTWPESLRGTRFLDEGKMKALEGRFVHETSEFESAIKTLLRAGSEPNSDFTITPPALTLSGDPRKAWLAFNNEVEAKMKDGAEYDGRLAPFAARMAENALRLSTLFTIYADPNARSVSLPALKGAIAIVQHAMNEASRIIGVAPQTALETDADAVLQWMREKGEPVTSRDIQNKGPSKIRKAPAHYIKETVLRHLEEAGAITRATTSKTITFEVAT